MPTSASGERLFVLLHSRDDEVEVWGVYTTLYLARAAVRDAAHGDCDTCDTNLLDIASPVYSEAGVKWYVETAILNLL